jgi:hypothetical protein
VALPQRYMKTRNAAPACCGLALLTLVAPTVSVAQAWLPDKGTASFSLAFNDVLNREHWTPTGDTIDVGHTRSQTYAVLASYGLTDRWMLSASLPYVETRFWGPLPSHGGAPEVQPVDNGDTHGAWTDLRVGVHYQALEKPFALAPYVAYVVPISDYYSLGHASQGRDLTEWIVGFNVGKNLSPWLRRTYTQLRYSYAFVEELEGVSHDRSNLNFELGTFITQRWNVSLYTAQQWTHGGIDVPIPRSNPLFPVHDRIADDEFFNAGLGTGFAITPEITSYLIYMHGFSGINGHRVNQGLTFGLSYGFRPRAEAVGIKD